MQRDVWHTPCGDCKGRIQEQQSVHRQRQRTSARHRYRATLRPAAPAMSAEWPRRFPVNSESIMPAVWPWLTLMLSAQWREVYRATARTMKCSATVRTQPRSIAQPWARQGLGPQCRCTPQLCMAQLVWVHIPSFPRARQAHARHSTAQAQHARRGSTLQHTAQLTLLAGPQLKQVVCIRAPPAACLLGIPAAALGLGLPEADTRRAAAVCRRRLLLVLRRRLNVCAIACEV